MKTIKVGSSVKITSYGRTFPNYDDWIKVYAPEFLRYFKDGSLPLNGSIGEIVAIGNHLQDRCTLHLIRYDDEVYIMSLNGFELYKNYEVELL